jgi:glycosyltransferase involved in cell wall biosynthesis
VESIMLEQARRLHQRGHAVTVFAGRGGPLDADGPRLAMVPEIDSRRAPVGSAEVLRRLDAALGEHACEVLIVHNALTMHFNLDLTAALFEIADRGRPRLVSWVHDLSWTNPLYRTVVKPEEPYTLLRRYHPAIQTVCVSEERRREWVAISQAPPQSARVIHNGIDPLALLQVGEETRELVERLRLLETEALLLAPVRITRRKNLEWALEAAAALRAEGRSVRLIVTGPPGPHDPQSLAYLEELRQKSRRLGVEDSVSFLFEVAPASRPGYPVGAAMLKDLYMLSDVVVLPSASEGFGLPLAEAALFKTPVVCTDLPVFHEVGVDGARFVPLTAGAAAFAAAVKSALESKEALSRRRVLDRLSWDRIVTTQLEPLIQSLSA